MSENTNTNTSDAGSADMAALTSRIDLYLSRNRYEVAEDDPHIELVDDPGDAEFDKLVRVCPAACYRIRENGTKSFDYSGCLECGTCRIACGDTIVKSWRYPVSGCGVQYRFG